MQSNSEPKCLHITWLDSSLQPRWVYDDGPWLPKKIESVGFLCGMTPESVTITCGHAASGGKIAPLTIPNGCILMIHRVELTNIDGVTETSPHTVDCD